MEKVLIIVGDAAETVDTLYPFYRLQEGGYQPVVAAPEKRKYQMVMHEVKPGWTITKKWEGYTINADITFAEIKPEDYCGICVDWMCELNGRPPRPLADPEVDLAKVERSMRPASWILPLDEG
jgi:protease I